MKLKNEIEYVFRILLYMTVNKDRDVISSQEISLKEKIPHLFSFRILKKLEKQGLLKIVKGSKGGYILAKKPEEITFKDTMYAVDDNLIVKETISEEERGASYDIILEQLRAVEEKFSESLERVNFKDISEEWEENTTDVEFMKNYKSSLRE